jgi:hypothetical protein
MRGSAVQAWQPELALRGPAPEHACDGPGGDPEAVGPQGAGRALAAGADQASVTGGAFEAESADEPERPAFRRALLHPEGMQGALSAGAVTDLGTLPVHARGEAMPSYGSGRCESHGWACRTKRNGVQGGGGGMKRSNRAGGEAVPC